MALLAYQSIRHLTTTGGGIALTVPNVSDTIAPDDRGFLYLQNSNASPRVVTIPSPAGLDFGTKALPDQTYDLAGTLGFQWIPMSAQLADPVTGLITINIDATAGVVRAAIRR